MVALGIEGWFQEGPGVSNIMRDRVLDGKPSSLQVASLGNHWGDTDGGVIRQTRA